MKSRVQLACQEAFKGSSASEWELCHVWTVEDITLQLSTLHMHCC